MPARGPSQALNLANAPSPYSDSFFALDLMKGVTTWSYWTGTEGIDIPRADLPLDDKGWLTSLPVINGEPTGVYANVFYGSIAPAGEFIMEWKGDGDIDLSEPFEVIGHNRIRFTFDPDYVDDQGRPQQDGITIIINAINADNHLRDIKLYRAEDADLIAGGERFDPDWFNAIDDYRILRTHDWQYTNFPETVDWSRNVVAADQAVWGLDGRGMPYELLVDTANETRSDLWVNIPHTASDEYMRQAARYLRNNLDPDLRVHVEFSNEHFTTIFEQYPYFQEGGAAAFGDAPSAAAQFYGVRSARMDAIFDRVFGADAGRLRSVVTVDSLAFLSDEAELMLTAPASRAEGGGSPVSAGVEVLATDGYLSWWTPTMGDEIRDWMTDADGGFQRAADFLMDQLNNDLIPSWRAGRALADEYGMEFMVYEGGTLLLNNATDNPPQDLTDFAAAFSRSEELEPVYAAMAAAWAEIGTGPFAWYSDTGRPGPWGSYGHWDAIDFAPLPRTGAIIDANGIAPGWSGDNRPGSTFDNGHYDAGTMGRDVMRGTALDDRLYGLAGADTLKGGQGRDALSGGDGADVLRGGAGADRLTGGAGDDLFVFAGRGLGADRITDWSHGPGDDRIALDAVVFGFDEDVGIRAAALQSSTAGRALTDRARIVHDTDSGRILFDADGRGGDAAVHLASIRAGVTLTLDDLILI